jgi:hypothetical protein
MPKSGRVLAAVEQGLPGSGDIEATGCQRRDAKGLPGGTDIKV